MPADVIVVTDRELGGAPALLPEELAAVVRAVPARVREFALGRSCARAALAQLGCLGVAIPAGAQREPIWPPGFIGSITHCEGHCAAAVARLGREGGTFLASLGLDAEPALRLPQGLEDSVALECERAWVAQGDRDGLPRDRLLFSAKESVFKCLFPLVRRFVDFHDVEVIFVDDVAFRVRATWLPAAADHLHGRFAVRRGLVLTTAIWVGPGAPLAP